MLEWLLPPVADYVTRNCKQFVKISPMLMVHSMLRLFGNTLDELRFVNCRKSADLSIYRTFHIASMLNRPMAICHFTSIDNRVH